MQGDGVCTIISECIIPERIYWQPLAPEGFHGKENQSHNVYSFEVRYSTLSRRSCEDPIRGHPIHIVLSNIRPQPDIPPQKQTKEKDTAERVREAYSFSFSLSHLVAVSTPSSMFSGLVP